MTRFQRFLKATFVAFFLSLALGWSVHHLTPTELWEMRDLFVAAGASTGLMLTVVMGVTWLENDPVGVLKLLGAVTAGLAVLVPLLFTLGWVLWQVIFTVFS